jgi:hypothetical protein
MLRHLDIVFNWVSYELNLREYVLNHTHQPSNFKPGGPNIDNTDISSVSNIKTGKKTLRRSTYDFIFDSKIQKMVNKKK